MKTTATRFNPVTTELIAELQRAVGEDCVHVDDDTLSVCASDETEDFVFRPEVVVAPRNTDGVAAVMRLASQKGFQPGSENRKSTPLKSRPQHAHSSSHLHYSYQR